MLAVKLCNMPKKCLLRQFVVFSKLAEAYGEKKLRLVQGMSL